MKTDFDAEYNHGLVEEEIQKNWNSTSKFSVKEDKSKKNSTASPCFHIQAVGFIWDT